jgi:hypothetical protein
MNQRTLLSRLLSPAGFGLVLILFLLPFATVSCGAGTERVDATLSGVDLAIGSMPAVSSPDGSAETAQAMAELWVQESDLEPLALLAGCAVVAGMLIGLVRRRPIRFAAGAGIAVLAGALIVAALVRVPSQVRAFLARVAGPDGLPEGTTASTSITYGSYVVLALLVGLAAGNGIAFWRARGEQPEPAPTPIEEPGRLSLDELT